MSKSINNYRGRHRGYKQRKPVKDTKRTGISAVGMMYINYIAKSKAFMKTREVLRKKAA